MFSIAPTPDEEYSDWQVFAFRKHHPGHEFAAMIKTLLLHGEIDALFKLAAYVPERLTCNWSTDCGWCSYNATPTDLGWRYVRDLVYPFVYLNVSYAMRMTSRHDTKPESQDYRRTKAYQVMLLRCTGFNAGGCYRGQSAFDPKTFPHRQFFGVYREQYRYIEDLSSFMNSPQRMVH